MFDTCRAKYNDIFFTIFRVVFGLFFLLHGLMKFGVLGGPSMVGTPIVLAAAIVETLGGLLILLGLWTSIAAFISSGQMAVAYFMGHAMSGTWYNPLANGGELAVLFCFAFLYLAFAGSGKYSLDATLCKTPAAKK